MSEFDLVVVGGGTGNNVAARAAAPDRSVALVEKGKLGGACLTRGCIPTKTLIHRADVVEQIADAGRFGIDASVDGIDFDAIVRESTEPFDEAAAEIEEQLRDEEQLTLYKEEAEFVDERTLRAGDEEITGETVIVAVGARPAVPSSIDGIEDVDYITSREAMRLDELPDHLVVVGGGYIAAELGHAYGRLGSDVTILGHGDALVPREDPDVAQAFTDAFERRYDVYTGYEVGAVSQDGDRLTAEAESDDGDAVEVTGDALLVATGRTPNTDVLNVEAAGIETDEKGYVETNEYLETSAEGVWAYGDVIDGHMFRHAAEREAEYVYRNAVEGERRPVDYAGMSHAVFTSPQIASTGRTEAELRDEGRAYVAGRADYTDTAMGTALKADDGFVKVLADPDDGEILGCHIVGPDASTLVHEAVVAVTSGSGTVSDVADAIHVHPALNEVVQRAFEDAEKEGENA